MSTFGRGMQSDVDEVNLKLDLLLKYHQIEPTKPVDSPTSTTCFNCGGKGNKANADETEDQDLFPLRGPTPQSDKTKTTKDDTLTDFESIQLHLPIEIPPKSSETAKPKFSFTSPKLTSRNSKLAKKRASTPSNFFGFNRYDNALIISNPIMEFPPSPDPLNSSESSTRYRSQSNLGSPIDQFLHSHKSSENEETLSDFLHDQDVRNSEV